LKYLDKKIDQLNEENCLIKSPCYSPIRNG